MQLFEFMKFLARDGKLHEKWHICGYTQTNVFALRTACNQVLYCVKVRRKNEIKCSSHISKQISMFSGEYFQLNLSIDGV